MEKMFGQMMHGFFDGISEVDKQRMKTCYEKIAVMCPCINVKDMPEEAKKAMKESMKSFCGGMMERMSACLDKANAQTDQAESSSKA
jgi:hypothetical protein